MQKVPFITVVLLSFLVSGCLPVIFTGATASVTELAKEVLGKTDTHEVTFEIPKGSDGTFKVTIKPQYPRPGGKEKKEN